jgi:iron complex outermembrane receptor protein
MFTWILRARRSRSASIVATLLTTASSLSVALAQVSNTPPPASSGANTLAPESPAESAPIQLDQIVVTARKRKEDLVDVPLTVQAFGAEQITANRIDSSTDLVGDVPSLYFSSNLLSPGRDFLNLVVRGIGAQSEGSPAVPTFVDGVYAPSLAFDMDFIDPERVEVLQGPQGTLFGRNAEGGALNIVLKRPDNDFEAKTSFSDDTLNTPRAQASVSGPLVEDKLFALVAGDVSSSQGFLQDCVIARQVGAASTGSCESADSYTRESGRAALRFVANSALEFYLTVDGASQTGLSGLPGVPRGLDEYYITSQFQLDGVSQNYGGAFHIDADVGAVKLTSITADRHLTSTLPFDFSGTPEYPGDYQDLRTQESILSQELRLTGRPSDTLNWLGGLYGFTETHDQQRYLQFTDIQDGPFTELLSPAQNQNLRDSGVAAFADVTYDFVSRLELDAGLRYSYDSYSSNELLNFTILPGPLVIAGAPSASAHSENDSPSISLRYKFLPNMNVYARYAEGYRAGGYPLAPSSATTDIAFAPETTRNYEMGYKAASSMFNVDLSAFAIDILHQQVSTIVYENGNVNLPVATVGNAAKSRSLGFTFSGSILPVPSLELSSNVGYTHAYYISYIDDTGVSHAGQQFPFTPKLTGQASAQYTAHLGNDTDLQLYGYDKYVSSILSGSGVGIDIQFHVKAYDVGGLRASVLHKHWKWDLYVDNLANKFIETRVWNAFFFDRALPYSEVLPPRVIGGRVTYAF